MSKTFPEYAEPLVISASEAVRRSVSPRSLHYTADWHEDMASRASDSLTKMRHERIASRVRAVAFRARDILNSAA